MMKLIDSHIHFWNPTQLRYKWLDDLPAINKPCLPADLPTAGDDWQMEKLVFVQADCAPNQALDEVKWVTQLATEDARIQGIVAYAPLERDDHEKHLEKLLEYPQVKGIRRLIQSEGPGFSTKKNFVAAVRSLPAYGYTFDICVLHHQLPDVLQLVEWAPEVEFVLDHLGKPGIKDGDIHRWKENITRLAAFDNVRCKLSGMVTEANLDHWKPTDLQPYIDHVIEAFGVERVMFGGDYPVLELAHTTYTDWVRVAMDALSSLTDEQRQQVFYENANKFYRL